MTKKGKTIEIDSTIHRRILQFLNAAKRPEDLMEPPENKVRPEWTGKGRKRPVDHDPPDRGKQAGKRKPIMKREEAECILAERNRILPLYGFIHIDQIAHLLDWDRILELIKSFLEHFGHAIFGEWVTRGSVVKDGTSYQVAHGALLRTGEVLFIEAKCGWNEPISQTPMWNPETEEITVPVPPDENLYCSGHAFLSDGRLLVVGGGGENGSPAGDPKLAVLFDPETRSWSDTKAKDVYGNIYSTKLNQPRWYPTVVTLGDDPGRALIASGHPAKMEIYSEKDGTFSLVTATPDPTMDVDTNGDKTFPQLYPGLHPLSGGEVFYAPVGFADSGEDLWNTDDVQESGYFDFTGENAGKWTDLGAAKRTKGMSVLLVRATPPYIQVMMVGGGTTTEKARQYQLINLSSLSTAWQSAQSLPTNTTTGTVVSARIHPNVVLLPDGTVFVCGGTGDTDAPSLLYDPETGDWSRLAHLASFRAYHSLALLLPSGEVLVTGGSNNQLEVFRPPYLHMGGTPPKIGDVTPTPIHHGRAFTVNLTSAADIRKVTLVRPMAVTHQTDSEQRVIPLCFSQTETQTLSATAPNGWHPHALAPKGWYMLFVIDDRGVPSKGEFVFLH